MLEVLFDNYDYDSDDDFDYMVCNHMIKNIIDSHKDYKISGYIQRWDGERDYEFVLSGFKGIDDFTSQATKDCDLIKWEHNPEDDNLYLTCSHHDGTNKFTLVPIN